MEGLAGIVTRLFDGVKNRFSLNGHNPLERLQLNGHSNLVEALGHVPTLYRAAESLDVLGDKFKVTVRGRHVYLISGKGIIRLYPHHPDTIETSYKPSDEMNITYTSHSRNPGFNGNGKENGGFSIKGEIARFAVEGLALTVKALGIYLKRTALQRLDTMYDSPANK